LFLQYANAVKSMTVEPAGAITIQKDEFTSGKWNAYTLRGRIWGRARISITYADGLLQTIHYMVIKPEAEAVADMGHFLTTNQWFSEDNDPFHRAPSVITYDRELNHIVTQDSRVWIAGLSDEGGAGSWLAAFMKQLGAPDKTEIDKLEQFVDGLLWGKLQLSEGDKQFGVRKSLFYYHRTRFPLGTTAMTSTGRRGPAGTRKRQRQWTAPSIIRMLRRRTGCYTGSRAIITVSLLSTTGTGT